MANLKKASILGRQVRAFLSPKQVEKRNEIKIMLSCLCDTPYGRVSDSEVIGKALELYHEHLIVKQEKLLPEGRELSDEYKSEEEIVE